MRPRCSNDFTESGCVFQTVRNRGSGRFVSGHLVLGLEIPLPDLIDRRVDDQLEQERGEDSAHHGRGDPLHYVTGGGGTRFITSEPVPVAQRMGARPTKAVATVMNLGRSRFTAPSRMAACR